MSETVLPEEGSAPEGAEFNPRVFISYCHYEGGESVREKVRALAKRLSDEGIECELDQYHETTPPSKGWPPWMLDQIGSADYVLVVCTPTYYRRFRGQEAAGVGKGGVWEGRAITQALYDASGRNDKFIPIAWASYGAAHPSIPDPLRPTTFRDVSTEEGYEGLYRQITRQPAIVKPTLGKKRVLPPLSGPNPTPATGTEARGGATTPVRTPSSQQDKDRMITILFLSADPISQNRLRIQQEIRDVREQLELSTNRQNFAFQDRLGARLPDVSRFLLTLRPDVVHFSGHGDEDRGLCLEGSGGATQFTSARTLSALFSAFRDTVRCVVLNACYSEDQAKAIGEHVDFVVGMNDAIKDTAAIAFSVGFYQALSEKCSVRTAYNLGLVQISGLNVPDDSIPVLLVREGANADAPFL